MCKKEKERVTTMNTPIEREKNNLTSKSEIKEDLFIRFIDYTDVKEKSLETYTRALKQFSNYLKANSITYPTREDVITYRESLKQTKKANTVQLYLIAVKQFFKWTACEGIYPNVADNVKGVTVSKGTKKDYLTTSQVKDLLTSIQKNTIKGKRDYAIITLMVTCGLRDIEVSRANTEDLRTKQDSTVLYLQGKGRDDREDYVIIPHEVEKAIREYLQSRDNDSKALFTSDSNHGKGERLTTRSISRIVKTAMKYVGLDSDRLTAHSLRHTAVTHSLLEGESLQEVKEFARHSNINTTLIYAHNLEKESNECSNKLAELFI